MQVNDSTYATREKSKKLAKMEEKSEGNSSPAKFSRKWIYEVTKRVPTGLLLLLSDIWYPDTTTYQENKENAPNSNISAFSHFLTPRLQIGVCSMGVEGHAVSTRGKLTADLGIQDASEEIYRDRGKASHKWPCDRWKDRDFETDASLAKSMPFHHCPPANLLNTDLKWKQSLMLEFHSTR